MELKTARQIARLTQRALATKAGVHVSTISLLESDRREYGKVAYQDIVRIARALNVDPEEFFPVPELPASDTAAVKSRTA